MHEAFRSLPYVIRRPATRLTWGFAPYSGGEMAGRRTETSIVSAVPRIQQPFYFLREGWCEAHIDWAQGVDIFRPSACFVHFFRCLCCFDSLKRTP